MSQINPFRSAVAAVLCLVGVGSTPLTGLSLALADTFLPNSVQGMQAYDGNSPYDVNFLRVKNGSGFGQLIEERVVAVFDIVSLGTLSSDTLNVFVDYGNLNDPTFPGGTFNIYAFSGNDTASILQWNAGSLIGSFIEGSGIYPLGHASWVSIDVTPLLLSAAAEGDQYIGFNFRAPCCSSLNLNPAANLDASQINISNPVPEPETYAMLLAGLGLLGFHARRRILDEVATA